jgi:hypothetical protein
VDHACNPSYSGGRDQEDHGLKPAQANSGETLSQKNPSPKRAGGVARGVGLEFKPQYKKKEKRKKKKNPDQNGLEVWCGSDATQA